MAPVIFQLKTSGLAEVKIISTAQQPTLLDDLFELFNFRPNLLADPEPKNHSLGALTSRLCQNLDDFLKQNSVSAILAVGDTTTVFTASLIAFYHQIPFGHIEAGLRTRNSMAPFPEEMNRVLTASLATWHFAPTETEKNHLLQENVPASKIIITGNPVIDTLYWILKHKPVKNYRQDLQNLVIVTIHRRENWGKALDDICMAIIALSERFSHLNFILPVHPNPNVKKRLTSLLEKRAGIHLLPPLNYDEFVHLMSRSILVMTDSGGIQEEAPALSKPVLILRDTTERPAIVMAGVGVVVGTKTSHIFDVVSQLITNPTAYAEMAKGISPYGDGFAAKRIVQSLFRSEHPVS